MVIKLNTTDSAIKADMSTGDNNNDLASSRVVIPLVEKQSEVRIAYKANVESQKALLSAFKEQEQWAENAYKNTERRYRAYEDIIDKAFKDREIMDNTALDLYRKTVEEAGAVYRETIKHSMQICKQTTDQAWQSSIRAYAPIIPRFLIRLKSVVHSSIDRLTRAFKNITTKLVVTYQRMRMRILARTSL